MKRIYLLVLISTVSAGSQAQQVKWKSGDRMFLPSDTFWGYAQFDIAPPHNEIDPNICRSDAGKFGGVNAPYIWVRTPKGVSSWQAFDKILNESE